MAWRAGVRVYGPRTKGREARRRRSGGGWAGGAGGPAQAGWRASSGKSLEVRGGAAPGPAGVREDTVGGGCVWGGGDWVADE